MTQSLKLMKEGYQYQLRNNGKCLKAGEWESAFPRNSVELLQKLFVMYVAGK